ncbi:hypothetical protein ACVW00_001728 [Marmoricola sp. URHA0025 HA25]
MTARRTFTTAFVGILLIQAAWIAAMPAFRGPDEFDHVYRAEGVSHGAIVVRDGVPTARGGLTPVRRSVIDAASGVCASLPYTLVHNCEAYGPYDGEWGEVGSGANSYNPAYYVVAGNVGRFFDGVAVDYVIRAVTAIICALLLAWAAALWMRDGPSRWRTLAFAVALTPVLTYSTAIAAPNGVSYAAAVLLWTAGLTFLSGAREDAPRGCLAAVVTAAIVLCNTHTTGPMWTVVILLTWLLLKPAAVWQTLRDARNWPAVALIGLGGVASVLWTISSGANLPSSSGTVPGTPEIGQLASNEFLWLVQTIAAFPLRNELAPPAVYILWVIGFTMLLVHGLRSGGRAGLIVVWLIVATFAIQTGLTYVGFQTDGYAWQGRYGLPLTVALALIPAYLDSGRRQPFRPLYHCALFALPIATAISIWHVAHNERNFLQRPWTDYLQLGPTLAGLLAACGTLILIKALAGSHVPAVNVAEQPRVAEVTGSAR